jgi:DNA-binding transcriptional MerR regulator
VSSRTYLSIGDVLTLLREEFPDVTISKIRFLESQGLVNPERSPSGYRKFFDHDVERLRWVLRQQREHFLPLKVIRDRLDAGDLDDLPAASGGYGKATEPAHTTSAVASGPGAARPAAPAPPTRTEDESTKADDEAMARILADASRRAARLPETTPPARRGLQVVDDAGAAAPASMTPAESPPRLPGPVAEPVPARTSPPEPPARAAAPDKTPQPPPPPRSTAGREAAAPGPRQVDPVPSPRAAATAPAPGPASRAVAAPPPTVAPPNPAMGIVTGASLTADELCSASGLTAEELAGLEGFGLIESVSVAGLATYDEDALTMANLAAGFRTFGIEPRHLRLYRNAVDRELGLIEQVVIPLLRQRNPESRQRATEGAEQLAALGQSVRAVLLRTALRRHLGG